MSPALDRIRERHEAALEIAAKALIDIRNLGVGTNRCSREAVIADAAIHKIAALAGRVDRDAGFVAARVRTVL